MISIETKDGTREESMRIYRNLLISGLCLLTLTGCSKKNNDASLTSSTDSTSVSVVKNVRKEFKAADEIQQDLSAQGWNVKFTDPGSLGLFDASQVVYTFAAKNQDAMIMFGTWFHSAQEAQSAYQTIVPSPTAEGIQDESGDNYQQAFVTLPDGGGYWLIRQIGGCVFGVWSDSQVSEPAMAAILDSYQSA